MRPKRLKVMYGGRGGAKSWTVATVLIAIGNHQPIRVLCAREFQTSIVDSVHKLLKDRIFALGLGNWEPQDKVIYGPTFYNDDGTVKGRTEFRFEGLKHNIQKIRSYEGVDYCWVEEAAKVSKESWLALVPTIRKAGSEIWLTFNPDLETDYIYETLVKNHDPERDLDTVLMPVNWRDNPWFFDGTMDKERLALKAKDPEAYLNVWEGQPKTLMEGAVYTNELQAMALEGRLTSVPYDPIVPVDAFFDLGRSDATSIWFRQRVGFEWHYVDYFEATGQYTETLLKVLETKRFKIATVWLPHDAKAKTIGTKLSVGEQFRAAGHNVRYVKMLSLADGINAGRTIFGNCWFDKERCAEGIHALRHYRYEIIEERTGTLSKVPVHDWSSHGADAFRYSAVSTHQPRVERLARQQEVSERGVAPALLQRRLTPRMPSASGWMK